MLRGTSGGRTLHVLHVEDDPAVRAVIQRILSHVGHEVHSVPDAEMAFELLANISFDIIIMDRSMAGVDGIEATRRVRARHGPAGLIPIIGLTGSDDPEDIVACRAAGMSAVLIKPVSAKVLRETIAEAASHGFEWRADQMEVRLANSDMAVVDLDQLAEILGETDRVELLAHLRLFLSYLPKLIDRIERAAADGQCSAVVEPAHAAKGAAATAAALRLRDLLGRIESAARGDSWPEVSALIPAIRPESQRIQLFVDESIQ